MDFTSGKHAGGGTADDFFFFGGGGRVGTMRKKRGECLRRRRRRKDKKGILKIKNNKINVKIEKERQKGHRFGKSIGKKKATN